MTQTVKPQITGLRNILNAWDPIGVLPDWPIDEYDCLVYPILKLLRAGATLKDLNRFLKNELVEHFGLDPALTDSERCSEDILVWWNTQ